MTTDQKVIGLNPIGVTYYKSYCKEGSLAQLNRASDYGSEGYRFESYRSHKEKIIGSLAQLNRAFDYGSKGYRFESYRSHFFAEIAQLVEHNLAKVGVASSSLVFRSFCLQHRSSTSPGGGMVDALVSGTSVSNDVQVRVLFWAL